MNQNTEPSIEPAPLEKCRKVKYPYDRKIIQELPLIGKGGKNSSIGHVQNYLKQYGYLSRECDCDGGSLDEVTSDALATFQKNFNLTDNPVGEFDNDTKQTMVKSRCGLPDILSELDFRTAGPWTRSNLTYAFGGLSRALPTSSSRDAVRRAMDTWTNAGVGLTFVEVLAHQQPDLSIEWRPAADPDHSMVGGVLAHADFPPGFSIIVSRPPLPLHFDDTEHTWVDGTEANGFDIETVALHELGHCLGLFHTSVPGSVMFPTTSSGHTMRGLKDDDEAAIRNLYGGSNPKVFSAV